MGKGPGNWAKGKQGFQKTRNGVNAPTAGPPSGDARDDSNQDAAQQGETTEEVHDRFREVTSEQPSSGPVPSFFIPEVIPNIPGRNDEGPKPPPLDHDAVLPIVTKRTVWATVKGKRHQFTTAADPDADKGRIVQGNHGGKLECTKCGRLVPGHNESGYTANDRSAGSGLAASNARKHAQACQGVPEGVPALLAEQAEKCAAYEARVVAWYAERGWDFDPETGQSTPSE